MKKWFKQCWQQIQQWYVILYERNIIAETVVSVGLFTIPIIFPNIYIYIYNG